MKQQFVLLIHRFQLNGGQEKSCFEIIRNLADRGLRFHVFCYEKEAGFSHQNIKFAIVPGHKIPIQWPKNIWFIFYTLANRKKIESLGKVISLGNLAIHSDFRIIQFVHSKYRKVVKKGHSFYPNAHSFFRRIYQNLFNFTESKLEKIAYNNDKQTIFCISHQVKKDLEENVLRKNHQHKLIVAHHAAWEIKNIPKDNEIVKLLFVGSLERKGIEKLINILSRLESKKWHIDILGDGNILKWQNMAKNRQLNDKITFHGHQSSTPYFVQADIFVFPSSYEPFGLVVTEALANDCSLLVSRECGAMELWEDRPDYLNLSFLDSDKSWAKGLDRLIEDEKFRNQLKDDAKRSFSKWDWIKCTRRYERYLT